MWERQILCLKRIQPPVWDQFCAARITSSCHPRYCGNETKIRCVWCLRWRVLRHDASQQNSEYAAEMVQLSWGASEVTDQHISGFWPFSHSVLIVTVSEKWWKWQLVFPKAWDEILKCLVLSVVQIYCVYCHWRGGKPEHLTHSNQRNQTFVFFISIRSWYTSASSVYVQMFECVVLYLLFLIPLFNEHICFFFFPVTPPEYSYFVWYHA